MEATACLWGITICCGWHRPLPPSWSSLWTPDSASPSPKSRTSYFCIKKKVRRYTCWTPSWPWNSYSLHLTPWSSLVLFALFSAVTLRGGVTTGKEPTCQCRRLTRPGFNPWVGKIPLEKEMATHSSILAGRIPMDRGAWWAIMELQRVRHDWSNLACMYSYLGGFRGGSAGKECLPMQETWVLIPGSGRFTGEENGTHSSILAWGNPMDREIWRATVHGVAKETVMTYWLTTPPPPSSLAKIFRGKGCSAAVEAGTQKVLRKGQLIARESKTLCLPWCGGFWNDGCLFIHSFNHCLFSTSWEAELLLGTGATGTNKIPGLCSYGDNALVDLSMSSEHRCHHRAFSDHWV